MRESLWKRRFDLFQAPQKRMVHVTVPLLICGERSVCFFANQTVHVSIEINLEAVAFGSTVLSDVVLWQAP